MRSDSQAVRLPARLMLRLSRGRGVIGSASITYTGMALSLVTAPLVARAIGAEGRGLLAGAYVSVQLLSWISFLGLPRGIAVSAAGSVGAVSRRGVGVLTGLGVVGAVLAFGSADVVAHGNEVMATLIRISSPLVVLAGLAQVGSDLALSQGRIVAWNTVRVANLVVPSACVIVAFAFDRLTLPVVFWTTYGGQLLGTLVGVALALPAVRRSGGRLPWRFSVRFWSASAVDVVSGRVDQLLLAALASTSDLGVYAIGVTCANAAAALTQAFNATALRRFVEYGDQDVRDILRRRSLYGGAVSALLGAAVVLATWAFARPLLGADFIQLPAVTAALVVGQLLNDQWYLRTYLDSARLNARGLTLASALGLVGALALIALFTRLGPLTDIRMAIAMIAVPTIQLAVRGHIRRSQPS